MACEYSPRISIADFLVSVLLSAFFLALANQKKKALSASKPHYRYYFWGLFFKLVAVTAFLCIFVYYYVGGDTLAYHEGALAMKNLFFESPGHYLDLMFGPVTWEKYLNYFNGETCYPPSWMIKKESNFTVIRMASLIQLFLSDFVLAPNLVVARIAYGGIFRLYGMFCEYFPGREKALSFAFLFMPSVAFWGSGIMKDTIALTGICWMVVLFDRVAIRRKTLSIFAIAGLIAAAGAVYLVKTYLVLALMLGMTVWLNFQRIRNIKSRLFRLLFFPLFLLVSGAVVISLYMSNADFFGVYGADNVLEEAAKVQQDLVREESYGSNNFDIGKFDPTLAGVMSKVPEALLAGLLRPFIWESGGSPTMILAGIENLVLLVLFVYALLRTRVTGFFKTVFSNPLLILCFIFTLLLAFSIGLTSANFGALVRYKVPLVPFFVSMIVLSYPPKKES